ncbi:MAG: tyrosine-type recombinase/integrase [Hyphomicrobiaceae bacterium]
MAEGYGYALAWLAQHGSLIADTPPEARWTADTVQAYIANLQARVRPATVHNRVLNLERALAVLAPHSDRSMLRRAIRSLDCTPDRAGKRVRLQDSDRLVELGFKLMADAEAGVHKNARKNAAVYRDGLQIALLALRSTRKGNFSSIQIGTHLVWQQGAWWLIFQGNETKTHQPIELPFPEQLVPALTRYLDHYRPLLAGNRYRGDRLWISYWFKPQAAHSIQLQVVDRTRAAFGRSINPHLFRDCLATSIAIHDPENVRMAAALLGHRSFATTERHYNLARTLQAARSYQHVISAARTAKKRGRGRR